MFKHTKKLTLNFKIFRYFLIPTILLSTPFFNSSQVAKAGFEIQWEQDSGYRRLKWFQKENKKRFKNTIYLFLRPSDRRDELLKVNIANPKPFKTKLNKEKISLCKVKIGGFDSNTKCLKDIPADIEITSDKKNVYSIDIYPYSPIPSNRDSYAVVLKVMNPKRTGLYQFHSKGQYKGQSVSSYLGSWTIVID